MSSKRRKSCGGKIGYPTAEAADSAGFALARRTGERRLHVYVCLFSRTWHLGHPPKSVRQSLSAKARNRRQAS